MVNIYEVEFFGSGLVSLRVYICSRVDIIIDMNLLGSLVGGVGEKVVVREDYYIVLGGWKYSLYGNECFGLNGDKNGSELY